MKIEINRDEVRSLLQEINKKLLLLESKKNKTRRIILDNLLENKESELKQLAKILKVRI